MSTFYIPFSTTINNVPSIIYPMLGIEGLLNRSELGSIEKYLERLTKKQETSFWSLFQIVILWSDQVLMTDLWLFQQLESAETGYTIDCKNFRRNEEITGRGITASDGLIMLGREAEQEESVRKSGKSIMDEYVYGQRPDLPGELQPKMSFYTMD